ncbi:hypothetical protein HDU67_007181 [Dinochytrium kinnereticum]|nr:hypothetical protein HDU67_007181 [Dinochytrium kinnereticum]
MLSLVFKLLASIGLAFAFINAIHFVFVRNDEEGDDVVCVGMKEEVCWEGEKEEEVVVAVILREAESPFDKVAKIMEDRNRDWVLALGLQRLNLNATPPASVSPNLTPTTTTNAAQVQSQSLNPFYASSPSPTQSPRDETSFLHRVTETIFSPPRIPKVIPEFGCNAAAQGCHSPVPILQSNQSPTPIHVDSKGFDQYPSPPSTENRVMSEPLFNHTNQAMTPVPAVVANCHSNEMLPSPTLSGESNVEREDLTHRLFSTGNTSVKKQRLMDGVAIIDSEIEADKNEKKWLHYNLRKKRNLPLLEERLRRNREVASKGSHRDSMQIDPDMMDIERGRLASFSFLMPPPPPSDDMEICPRSPKKVVIKSAFDLPPLTIPEYVPKNVIHNLDSAFAPVWMARRMDLD